jgi:primosomal protein N''
VAIGIKRAGALLDCSITEQEKLMRSAKIPQPRRARKKVAILTISDVLARSSDEHPVMGWKQRG